MTRSESAVTTATSWSARYTIRWVWPDQRRGIAGDKMFVVAHAHHQRAAEPSGKQHVGMFAKNYGQSVGAAKLNQGLLNGMNQRFVPTFLIADGRRLVRIAGRPIRCIFVRGNHVLLFQATGNQMRDNFAIGRAAENVALFLELLLQHAKVFDHAVVNQRQHLPAADVWMGVVVVGGAMRRPAGVANADRPRRRRIDQLFFQQIDPPGRFHQRQFAVRRNGDDAGAVVPAVFQPMQPFDQIIERFMMANVSDNAAHFVQLSVTEVQSRVSDSDREIDRRRNWDCVLYIWVVYHAIFTATTRTCGANAAGIDRGNS